MTVGDPVIGRGVASPWPRGGVEARPGRLHLELRPKNSARTGAPVARLKPLPPGDRLEVLWGRRDAGGPAGPFGAVLPPDDARAFLASEPAFWIRA